MASMGERSWLLDMVEGAFRRRNLLVAEVDWPVPRDSTSI
jgi:hypothetical protein